MFEKKREGEEQSIQTQASIVIQCIQAPISTLQKFSITFTIIPQDYGRFIFWDHKSNPY